MKKIPNPGQSHNIQQNHSTTVSTAWGTATDNNTPAASLMYKLVRSSSNNLSSVSDAESNGTLVMDCTANTLTCAVTGLSATSSYYFAVLVKDADGKKALYAQRNTTTATPEWTWMSGSTTKDQSGTYGTKGVAATANVPRARYFNSSWTDANGTFWVFGGYGYDSIGGGGSLTNLWHYEP
jgi:hypothetical protein